MPHFPTARNSYEKVHDNSSNELRLLRIVPGARQYLTEIQFIIPHLLASVLQILKLTGSSNSTHERKQN